MAKKRKLKMPVVTLTTPPRMVPPAPAMRSGNPAASCWSDSVEMSSVEPVVQLLGHGIDVSGELVDQLVDLVDEQRDEQRDKRHDQQEAHQEHQTGGKSSLPAPLLQKVDRRLEGHGDEECDEDHEQEVAKPEQQIERQRGEQQHPGHDQRPSPERRGYPFAPRSCSSTRRLGLAGRLYRQRSSLRRDD